MGESSPSLQTEFNLVMIEQRSDLKEMVIHVYFTIGFMGCLYGIYSPILIMIQPQETSLRYLLESMCLYEVHEMHRVAFFISNPVTA